MGRFAMVVLTRAVPGRDAEFNDWYDGKHLHQVLQVEGFLAARRYRDVGQGGAGRYVAVYEVDADSPEAAVKALSRATAAGEVEMSDALDVESVEMRFWEPLGPEIRRG